MVGCKIHGEGIQKGLFVYVSPIGKAFWHHNQQWRLTVGLKVVVLRFPGEAGMGVELYRALVTSEGPNVLP